MQIDIILPEVIGGNWKWKRELVIKLYVMVIGWDVQWCSYHTSFVIDMMCLRCQNFWTRPWLSFLYFCYFSVFTPLMSFIPCFAFMLLWRNYVNLKSFTGLSRRECREGEKREKGSRVSPRLNFIVHQTLLALMRVLKCFPSSDFFVHLLLLTSSAQKEGERDSSTYPKFVLMLMMLFAW